MEYYSARRIDEILYCHLQQHGDLENIMLSEISQSEPCDFTHVGYKTETHRYGQQYGGYQREEG